MPTTRYADGAPCWTDLGTPDLDGAVEFYTGLFGWEYVAGGPETGGYGTFTLDGKTAGGAMTVTEEQGEPSWSVYFRSPDADATAQAVERAGGTVPFPRWTSWTSAGWPDSRTGPGPSSASGSRGRTRAWGRWVSRAACAGPSCTPRTCPRPPRSTTRSSDGRPP